LSGGAYHREWEVQTTRDIVASKRKNDGERRKRRGRVESASVSPISQIVVSTTIPKTLPPLREELALLRAFLSDEIAAILRGE
jgi:hypothetical protein